VGERLKARAVVLGSVDHGESDRVVTLLAHGRGKVAAFARGARASRHRFSGALEPFTLLSVELSGRTGADLLRLESASIERSFHPIRADLARIACAAYAVDLVRELTRDQEAHDDLFDRLVDYLGHLEAAPARPARLRAFELAALSAAGFRPRLDDCARCGAEVPASPAAFSPADGGLLCEGCARLAGPGRMAVSGSGIEVLRRLQASAVEGPPELDAGGLRESREVLGRFIEHLLGHRLKARRFLDEVGHLLSE
jgi:DNA repair protein RecO (recombination protein O)